MNVRSVVCGSLCKPIVVFSSLWHFVAACYVTSFKPQARRLMFARRLPPDYPYHIFSVSFVFLNSLLFCVISTVQWSGATSICDGIIDQENVEKILAEIRLNKSDQGLRLNLARNRISQN